MISKNIEDVFGGRKVYIPDTVTKVVNGVASEVHPNIDWWMIGSGIYPTGEEKIIECIVVGEIWVTENGF